MNLKCFCVTIVLLVQYILNFEPLFYSSVNFHPFHKNSPSCKMPLMTLKCHAGFSKDRVHEGCTGLGNAKWQLPNSSLLLFTCPIPPTPSKRCTTCISCTPANLNNCTHLIINISSFRSWCHHHWGISSQISTV